MFTQAQLDHLSTLRFINNVDNHLKVISAVKVSFSDDERVSQALLLLELYYDGEKINVLSFNLHNFSYEEIVDVARNIKTNAYIMREVDILLAGDIE